MSMLYLLHRTPISGNDVSEWVQQTTPIHYEKTLKKHRRRRYKKSRSQFCPSWLMMFRFRVLLMTLYAKVKFYQLCTRVSATTEKIWLIMEMLNERPICTLWTAGKCLALRSYEKVLLHIWCDYFHWWFYMYIIGIQTIQKSTLTVQAPISVAYVNLSCIPGTNLWSNYEQYKMCFISRPLCLEALPVLSLL